MFALGAADVEARGGEIWEGLFPGWEVGVVWGWGVGEGVGEDEGGVGGGGDVVGWTVVVRRRVDFHVGVVVRRGVLVGGGFFAGERVAFFDDAGEEEDHFLQLDVDWLQLEGDARVRVEVALGRLVETMQGFVHH